MKRFAGKFGFVHRLLWGRDGLYRAALLFGPAPLVGCALAVALWAGIQAVNQSSTELPHWAVVQTGSVAATQGGQPITLQPNRPLPLLNPDGSLSGYQPGWIVTGHLLHVSAMMEVNLAPATMNDFTAFSVAGPDIDMARIAAAGPQGATFAGLGSGFLVAKEPGVYALSARFDRPAGTPADCVIRLAFGAGQIVSVVQVNLINSLSRSYNVSRFNLQPGLYQISWGFGCWHEKDVVGLGRMTVLVGHPGEANPEPARAGDIVE